MPRAALPLTPGLAAVTRGGWAGFVVLFVGDLATLYHGRGSGLILYWVAAAAYAVAGHRAAAASPGRPRVACRDGALAATAAYLLTVPLRQAGGRGVDLLGSAVAVGAAVAVGGAAGALASRARRPAAAATPSAAATDAPAKVRVAATVATRWPVTRDVLELDGGRQLQYVVAGPADGVPVVLHHPTPGAAGAWRGAVAAVAGQGLRLVTFSRPGYGASTARPGRVVADTAPDVEALLDALGADRFAQLGWGGGGPHALATAARTGGRCAVVVVAGGLAPYEGLAAQWFDGMAAGVAAEYRAAAIGRAAVGVAVAPAAADLARADADAVAAALDGELADADRRALAGPMADHLAASYRSGLATSGEGWADDAVAAVRPWGFDLVEVTAPVHLVHGADDRITPVAHARWLADRLPRATVEVRPGDGHLSPVPDALAEVARRVLAATRPAP